MDCVILRDRFSVDRRRSMLRRRWLGAPAVVAAWRAWLMSDCLQPGRLNLDSSRFPVLVLAAGIVTTVAYLTATRVIALDTPGAAVKSAEAMRLLQATYQR